MKVFEYEAEAWAETDRYGLVIGPKFDGFICEDANRPGWTQTFPSEEECTKFCDNMNADGCAFFRLKYRPDIWDEVSPQIEAMEADKRLKAELASGRNEEFWFEVEMRLKGIRIRR